ncbi:zinc finger protein 280C-like isoform X2 [Centruroides sculpturatus]|uniref:zinc finger protein 280C-like isoform X2 n=1 Tax=Centruroides sculpturatus TaxID=218467 RepID=UPI000C6C903D|nr:zinc finger protein 280C-like isoform X2 [Centruroides sculpturatus]
MPSKCSIIGCRSNYRKEEQHVTVYTLPRKEPNRTKWLDAIPTDFSGLKNPMVCIKHFAECDIIRRESYFVNGELVSYRRRIPKLRTGAVPSIFPKLEDWYQYTAHYRNCRMKHRKRPKNEHYLSSTNIVEPNYLNSLIIPYKEIENNINFDIFSNNVNEEIIISDKHEDNIDLMMECSEDVLSEIQEKAFWKIDQELYNNCENLELENGYIPNSYVSDSSIENNCLKSKKTFNSVLHCKSNSSQSLVPTSLSSFEKKSQGKEGHIPQVSTFLPNNNLLLNTANTTRNQVNENSSCLVFKSTDRTLEPPVMFLPEGVLIDNPNASFQLVQTSEQLSKLLSNTDIKTERQLFIPEKLLESEAFKTVTNGNVDTLIEGSDKDSSESSERESSECEVQQEILQKRKNKDISSPKTVRNEEKQLKIKTCLPEYKTQNKEILKTYAKELIALERHYYAFKDPNEKELENFMKEDIIIKCYICKIVLLNNIKVMNHINTHINDQSLCDLPLDNPVECNYCLSKFNTPFDLHCHLQSVHWNEDTLLCRICNINFHQFEDLLSHMKILHIQYEMPYSCKLCQYRSSVYQDIIIHFYETHNRTEWMLCYYCLKVFHIKLSKNGIGYTKDYFYHLQKHQLKTAMRKCSHCCLIFLNIQERKEHQLNDHIPMIYEKGVHPFECISNKNQGENIVEKLNNELIDTVDTSHIALFDCCECGYSIMPNHFGYFQNPVSSEVC